MQMLNVKEKEEEEIMRLYRNLCEENQKLKQQAVEGDSQLQNQRYQIQSLEEALQRAQAQSKTVEEENQRITSDLKVIAPRLFFSCTLICHLEGFSYAQKISQGWSALPPAVGPIGDRDRCYTSKKFCWQGPGYVFRRMLPIIPSLHNFFRL